MQPAIEQRQFDTVWKTWASFGNIQATDKGESMYQDVFRCIAHESGAQFSSSDGSQRAQVFDAGRVGAILDMDQLDGYLDGL